MVRISIIDIITPAPSTKSGIYTGNRKTPLITDLNSYIITQMYLKRKELYVKERSMDAGGGAGRNECPVCRIKELTYRLLFIHIL
jgi:hypothetical protein